jgi:hypothetical protein
MKGPGARVQRDQAGAGVKVAHDPGWQRDVAVLDEACKEREARCASGALMGLLVVNQLRA